MLANAEVSLATTMSTADDLVDYSTTSTADDLVGCYKKSTADVLFGYYTKLIANYLIGYRTVSTDDDLLNWDHSYCHQIVVLSLHSSLLTAATIIFLILL